MSSPRQLVVNFSKRADLHCHSRASNEADEVLLAAINCPESYSEPRQVHAWAKNRGMDFVTITDHDSINGVVELTEFTDVLIGEELTCYFPEDGCKMHVLLWGITPDNHKDLQACANDLYAVAAYIFQHNIAHAVAHPLYRQNDKLDRWHVERLLLLFKGFECLNGAHSMRHRQAFEPLLLDLDAATIRDLEAKHGIEALWPRPWIKARTGGSDDHGLFNVGRTWTAFPHDVTTIEQVLDCLREGRCQPGGEAGSSIKLAHNFYGVGIRYCTEKPAAKGLGVAFLRRWVGDRQRQSRIAIASSAIRGCAKGAISTIGRKLRLKKRARGVDLLNQLMTASAIGQLRRPGALRSALSHGRPALAEHESAFNFMSTINRDTTNGIFAAVSDAIGRGRWDEVADSLSAIVAQQALLLPYYFALFHQNQERHLLSRLTGRPMVDGQTLRVGVFTDTCDRHYPAGRFALGLAEWARRHGVDLVVHNMGTGQSQPGVRAFAPLASHVLAGEEVGIPPFLEILEWADRKQFDVVVANTCGPMGLCAAAVTRMLRIPMMAVNHHDIPKRVFGQTGGDFRLGAAAEKYAKFFHGLADGVLVGSHGGEAATRATGVPAEKIILIPPSGPIAADLQSCTRRFPGVVQPVRLVVSGDVAIRSEMQFIGKLLRAVCKERNDIALLVLGDGRWVKLLTETAAGLPVHIVPVDAISSADLLLQPDSTDISGQSVRDAQAMGVTSLVSAASPAKEFMDDDLTGLVLPAGDVAAWASAILELLRDEPRRQRMARTARHRAQRFGANNAYEAVWKACIAAAHASEGSVANSDLGTEAGKKEVSCA